MIWGLIGASTIAAEHMIGAIRNIERAQLTFVHSGSQPWADSFAKAHGIDHATTDLAVLLNAPQIRAVYISSTNEKHYPQAMAAIAAGKHVLCEKPLAMTPHEAAQMVRAAEAKGVVFATNHHLRCAGSHRAAREVIAAGRIGRVLSLRLHHAVFLPPHLQSWRIDNPAAGGGVIADITVHDADVARFLLNEDPVSVVAQACSSGLGRGVEDSVMSVWSMPSGAMVMAHESFTHGHAGTGFEVHGTEGSIFARGVMTQSPVGTVEVVTAAGRETIGFDPTGLYDYAVQRFVAATEGKGTPAATGWDGVKSLAVATAVAQAARTGNRSQINYGFAQ